MNRVLSPLRELAQRLIVVAAGHLYEVGRGCDGVLRGTRYNYSLMRVGPSQLLQELGSQAAIELTHSYLSEKRSAIVAATKRLECFLYRLGESSTHLDCIPETSRDIEGIEGYELIKIQNPLAFLFQGSEAWLGYCGRYFELKAQGATPSPMHLELEIDNRLYSLTGRSVNGYQVAASLQADVKSKIDAWLKDSTSQNSSPRQRAIEEAQVLLEQQGYIQQGSLLLIGIRAEFIAHLIPAHRNSQLGMIAENELAIGCNFSVPPRTPPAGLQVFRRDRSGGWKNVSLNNGICLGGIQTDAVLNPLIAYLARAAVRVAAAGRFHERD